MRATLEEIMEKIEEKKGPVTVRELARELDIEPGALEGMLRFLERKGRLSVSRPGTWESCKTASCRYCIYKMGCPRGDEGEFPNGNKRV